MVANERIRALNADKEEEIYTEEIEQVKNRQSYEKAHNSLFPEHRICYYPRKIYDERFRPFASEGDHHAELIVPYRGVPCIYIIQEYGHYPRGRLGGGVYISLEKAFRQKNYEKVIKGDYACE